MSHEWCGGSSDVIRYTADEVFRKDNPQLDDLWNAKHNLIYRLKELQKVRGFLDTLFNTKVWQDIVITRREIKETQQEYDVTYKLLYDYDNPPKSKVMRFGGY